MTSKREWAFRAGVAAGFAYLWLGLVAAVVAAAATPVVARLSARRRVRTRSSRIDEAIPDFADSMSAALRAGASLPAALREADAHPDLMDALRPAIALFDVGGGIDEVLDVFSAAADTASARVLVRALSIGHRSGGDLPRVLDVLARLGRERAALVREARAAGAQARMSAWVVAALPIAFLFLTSATSREQTRMLTRTPAGWTLLAAGGALEAAGVLWMRRLNRL